MNYNLTTAARQDLSLNSSEKLFLFTLTSYINQGLECWPQLSKLMQDLNCKRSKIFSLIKNLSSRGYFYIRYELLKNGKKRKYFCFKPAIFENGIYQFDKFYDTPNQRSIRPDQRDYKTNQAKNFEKPRYIHPFKFHTFEQNLAESPRGRTPTLINDLINSLNSSIFNNINISSYTKLSSSNPQKFGTVLRESINLHPAFQQPSDSKPSSNQILELYGFWLKHMAHPVKRNENLPGLEFIDYPLEKPDEYTTQQLNHLIDKMGFEQSMRGFKLARQYWRTKLDGVLGISELCNPGKLTELLKRYQIGSELQKSDSSRDVANKQFLTNSGPQINSKSNWEDLLW